MMNENQDFEQSAQSNSEANNPSAEPGGIGKIKSYGQKSLGPLINLLQKYQTDVTPYFDAIGKGLEASTNSLAQEGSTDAEKNVSEWFREAHQWFDQVKSRLNSRDSSELLRFIEEQGRQHPGAMFSASYFVGLFIGRMGRHIGKGSNLQSAENYQGQTSDEAQWNNQTSIQ